MTEFRDQVRTYGVSERRAVQFITNDARRCQVSCEAKCPFYIWCSRDKDGHACTIKTLVDTHLCTKPYNNKMANVQYLVEVFGERIRKNSQWSCKKMEETIKNELEIEVPRIKILRLRKVALEGVAESLKQHYSRVRDFGHEVLLITGGQLLAAVGRDGNNQMFPICYAVVESENTDSWRWFIDLMSDNLELNEGRGLNIISDQQKGLENAVKKLLPRGEHRFCTRFPSSLLKRIFWNIAWATHKVAYTRSMKELEKHSKAAYAHLSKLDPKQWCKPFFSTHSLVDNTDNNMSKSFNSWIINERFMPLLTMLQEIHYKLMTRMRQKRDDMMKSDLHICPKIKKYLDILITDSRKWSAAWDGHKKFQVKLGTRSVTVDLDARSCDCRMFDLTGIPCHHAITSIHSRRHQPVDYVSEYYKREKYLTTYQYSLEAMKGEEYWDFHATEELLPPDIPKKLRGRPKKLRRREAWEGGSRS
ncbi:uncharacterized protein LOC141685244 [Apium graveolens]|uniref:uncharacterized protein LOC141685244 n=1 Tax=Apium graveolens TaxID=4045 RepID=UPI003D7B929D